MDGPASTKSASRRNFLKGALTGGAAIAASTAFVGKAGAQGDPLVTDVQDWNRYLGEGGRRAPLRYAFAVRGACGSAQRRLADVRSHLVGELHATS